MPYKKIRLALSLLMFFFISFNVHSQLVDFAVLDEVPNTVAKENKIWFVYRSKLYIGKSDQLDYFKSGSHLSNLKFPRVSQIYLDDENTIVPGIYNRSENEKYVKYQSLGENYLRTEFRGEAIVSEAEVSIETKGWDVKMFSHNPEADSVFWKLTYNEFDVVDGTYKDYYPLSHLSKIIQSSGKCIDGLKIGEWKYHSMAKSLISIVNYNSEGEIDGKYYEYYYDKRQIALAEFPTAFDEPYVLVTEGQYESVAGEIRKVGTWNFYSNTGKKNGTSSFSWEKE